MTLVVRTGRGYLATQQSLFWLAEFEWQASCDRSTSVHISLFQFFGLPSPVSLQLTTVYWFNYMSPQPNVSAYMTR